MSALVGVVGRKVEKAELESMLKPARHRGPDGSVFRVLQNGGVAAGELRVSSRSTPALAGGEAPIVLLDGEIYNASPDGRSNVELVRDLYLRQGRSCLSGLDGSFACVIVDDEETILARDSVGARPLIYARQDGCLYFASEAKSLLEHVSTVEELPPGHLLSSSEGPQPFECYTPHTPDFTTPEEAARILEELVVKAVEKRMQDGAIGGVSLSGGLDSSIMAAIARSIDPGIKLFSTTIKRYPSEDIEFARLMAEHLGLEHHIYEISDDDIATLIPDAIWYMETFDEDCVSGAIANFFTSKQISDFTKCVLVGEGADELFGGYFRELEDIPDATDKEAIARKLVLIAYNTALRRLDRGWLSNSVNYRTPYLDPEVVAFSNKLPIELKVRYDEEQGREVEKWILREALKGWLPKPIADRPKLRFARGTGVDDLMDELTAGGVTQGDLAASPKTESGLELNSPKELHFYRLFRDSFPKGYECLTARWDPFK